MTSMLGLGFKSILTSQITYPCFMAIDISKNWLYTSFFVGAKVVLLEIMILRLALCAM